MIKLIIGLGNVGKEYRDTRHNVGFEVINKIADGWEVKPKEGLGEFFVAEKEYDKEMVRLIWPTTYMNDSGLAVVQAMEIYRVRLEEVLIVFDDYYLPLGMLRIRKNGSDGGHNGMESVIYQLETEAILRLRVGTGPFPEGADSVEFVLNRFGTAEGEIKEKTVAKAAEAVLYLLNHRPEEAMNRYNRNPASED